MESPRSVEKPFLFPVLLLIFGFALFLRLTEASLVPFTRADADLAWQALEISRQENSGTSPIALYTGLTGLMFWLSSANNFFARLLPAVFGASLTLIPYALLKQKNSYIVLGLSLLLALDPILLVYSRQINGPILAISSLAWSFVFLIQQKQVSSGIAFGLAVLSGKYFWLAAILIGIYLISSKFSQKQNFIEKYRSGFTPDKSFFISAFLSMALVSSSFLLNPPGLTGIASGLVDLFRRSPQLSHPWFLPFFFLLSFSLYLIFPFFRAIFRENSHSWKFSIGYLIGLLVLSMVLHNQLPGIFVFVEVFLLLTIVGQTTSSKIELPSVSLVSLISYIFFLVIMVFSILSFSQFTRKLLSEFSFVTDLLPVLLALGLLIISYILIGLGWGFSEVKPAVQAVILSVFTLISLSFTFSQTWNQATVTQLLFSSSEILYPDNPNNRELAVFTANNAINPDIDKFRIENAFSKGDYWEFKDYANSKKVSDLPAFIVNDSVNDAGLMTGYRGTLITYARRMNLSDKAFSELLSMITTNTLPVVDIKKTLWINSALFPGGK